MMNEDGDCKKLNTDFGPRLRRSFDSHLYEDDDDDQAVTFVRNKISPQCSRCRAKSFRNADLPPQPAHLAALAEYDDDDDDDGMCECQQQIQEDQRLSVEKKSKIFPKLWKEDSVGRFVRLLPEIGKRLSDDCTGVYGSIVNRESEKLLCTSKIGATMSVPSDSHLPMITEAALGSHVGFPPPAAIMKLAKIANLLQKDQLPKKRVYVKNLILICATISLAFMPFFSLRTLQSSLNYRRGVGLISLGCFYASYVVSCVTAPAIVNKIRPKWTIFFSLWGQLVFNAANVYPTFYTMIPAAILAGYSCALLLIAQGTYIASVAASFSIVTERNIENVMTLFFGVFTLFLQSGQIVGNLISSLILQAEKFINSSRLTIIFDAETANSSEYVVDEFRPWNKSFCGAAYCHSYRLADAADHVPKKVLCILLVIYAAAIVLSLIISAACLDKLDIIFQSSKTTKTVTQQLRSLGSFYKNVRMILMLPMIFYSSFMQSFVFGDAVKAYVTCPHGIKMVGYAVVCYGLSSSTSTLFVGWIRKYTGRPFIILSASVGSMSLHISMLYWLPHNFQLCYVFVLFACLGAIDGIFLTESNSLIGKTFEKKESAFVFSRVHQALMLAVMFGISQFICVSDKIYIGIYLLGSLQIPYVILEIVLWKEKKLLSRNLLNPLVDV